MRSSAQAASVSGRPWRWVALSVVAAAMGVAVFHEETSVAPALSSASSTVVGKESPPVVSASSAVAPSWDERWRRWLSRLATPGNDAELAVEFEELVGADPARALANARREADPLRRASLVQAVLLLWAETDPTAAGAQARALPDAERAVGVAAVLAGAAGQPGVAARLAAEFCRDDPALASEHGYALIAALGRTGEYRAAIRFALGEPDAATDEDNNKWLKAAFAQWAEKNPDAAMAAAQELPGNGARFEALDAVVKSRARIDPAGIAETLRRMPPGADRRLALGQALRAWVERDPIAAANWLKQLGSNHGREADAGP